MMEQVPSNGATRYYELDRQIKESQRYLDLEANVRKLKFKQGLAILTNIALREAEPYLESNAQERGGLDLRYAENLPSVCGKQVIWFQGESSGDEYVKKIDCRKHWCAECGGKNGKIHKSRLHSIFSRINPDLFNVRQLVFTVPGSLRDKFRSREALNDLFGMSKDVVSKHFGIPVYDKKGWIKKYKLDLPVIAYFHAFGDESLGIFKPHINVHILEQRNVKLKITEQQISAIQLSWLKKLQKYDRDLSVVDFNYSFTSQKGKLIHRLKYMSRPWGKENYDLIDDENLKKLLVLELSGFQYLRYWGKLSNRTYKDEMDLSEVKNECENKIQERLISLSKGPVLFDFDSYKNRLVEIDEGFYLVKKKVRCDESKELEEKQEMRANGNVFLQ